MEQAFNNFNTGKYKQAYNQLNTTNINSDSYEPNLAICEYLSNGRSQNASHVCIRKLNNLIIKKNKRQTELYEQMTMQLMKYNVSILMLLNGKKENAHLLISDIYTNEKCFIDFLKYRMLLLLMELNISLKKNVQALKLATKYIGNPCEAKQNANQWISLLFHEHSRSSSILKQQLDFMMGILMSQAMMQLGLSESCLPPDRERIQLLEALLEKAKKRKNSTNKYYELNLQLVDRFFQAQKQFHQNNKQKAIQLLYFANIQSELEKMPQNKIITNIYSSLSYNNIGIIHYSYNKPCIALNYFNKAQTLLSKGCTGAEDKDLQLFSANYSSEAHKILYNLGLTSLHVNPTQAFQILDQLRKNGNNYNDFKYWYRMGQAELEHYHESYNKISKQNRQILLESALRSFHQSLLRLLKKEIPSENICKTLSILKEQQLETTILKMKGQIQNFKQNINLLICYTSLLLNQYHKVLSHGSQLVQNEKTYTINKIYSLQYMMEAYLRLGRVENALRCKKMSEKLNESFKSLQVNTYNFKKNEIIMEKMEIQTLESYQSAIFRLKQGSSQEAALMVEKSSKKGNKSESIKSLEHYLRKNRLI